MAALRPSPNSAAGLLAQALGARRSGRGWVAACVSHRERTPSLHISEGHDGRILVHCFGGCAQERVIDVLRARGLWANGNQTHQHFISPGQYRAEKAKSEIAIDALINQIWSEAIDPSGTIAEEYLSSRKLCLPPELRVSVLRFHPNCIWESGTAPCLIAGYRSIKNDKLTAIHRICLHEPRRWPRVERKMFGRVGGSAVKLDPIGDRLVIGEGIETAMAARQLGMRPVWALGSSGGIKTFEPLATVEGLTILGERDNGSNHNAAVECCNKWKERKTFLAMPPAGFKDYNDLIMERKNATA
jgi:putative DNA primase/helicase